MTEAYDLNARLERLSAAQRQSLRLVYRHHNSKEQARLLGISPHTVDERIKGALRILGVASRFEAARMLAEVETPQALVSQTLGGDFPTALSIVAPIARDADERHANNRTLSAGAGTRSPELGRAANDSGVDRCDPGRAIDGEAPGRRNPAAIAFPSGGGGSARDRDPAAVADRSRLSQRGGIDHDLDASGTWIAILATAAACAIFIALLLWGAGAVLDRAQELKTVV